MAAPRLNAYAIKKPRIVATIKDLYYLRKDPEVRLTATPFVENFEETVFIGGAVGWKGTKAAYDKTTGKLSGEFVEKAPPGVVAGLEKAIKVSLACEGVTGSIKVGNRWLPRKVICQMFIKGGMSPEEAKKKAMEL